MTGLNVLIAHGEPLIQIGLEGALSGCDDLHVQSIRETRSSIAGHIELASIDVAITDLYKGIELARGAYGGSSRVLIMTNDESEVGIRGAVEAGARGYILLSSTLESVVQAVRRVGRGGTAIDPRIVAKMLDSLNGNKLTDREIDVLRLITLGRSNKAIAEQLGIAVGTAKCHVKQLMAKLSARSRTEAASIAQRRGLVPPDPQRDRSASVDLREHNGGTAAHPIRRLPRTPSRQVLVRPSAVING
jgi:DNA-binding NarL/FixJ family response regulator